MFYATPTPNAKVLLITRSGHGAPVFGRIEPFLRLEENIRQAPNPPPHIRCTSSIRSVHKIRIRFPSTVQGTTAWPHSMRGDTPCEPGRGSTLNQTGFTIQDYPPVTCGASGNFMTHPRMPTFCKPPSSFLLQTSTTWAPSTR